MAPISNHQPHAVCFPYPAQGHINPMMKLAKLLHSKGFYITFIHTEYNQKRLLKSSGPNSLDGLPDFRFETIPDGLPPSSDPDSNRDILALNRSVTENCLEPFRKLLAKLECSDGVPPVCCIVADGIMTFTLDAAQEIGVPDFLFWTSSACGFLAYSYHKHLVEKGLVPLKDASYLSNGYLDTTIDWIPGMEGIRLKDLPTLIRTTDRNDFFLNFAIQETDRSAKASGIILNTYDELETEVLVALSSMFPPIYTIGPLHLLSDKIPQRDGMISNFGSSLWIDNVECFKWLDSKEPNSVLYVNFGSMTIMTPQQIVELAFGLANSKQSFLWIIRPDMVEGESAILPEEFVVETKERGLMTSWCRQEKILNHPSIGGFLSHMGWNSTIESLSSGVPMICCPNNGEQTTNCWFACKKWGVGLEIDGDVKRDEVEKVVRELMEGDKGQEMRKKALEWKNKAEQSADLNGKSFMNLDRLFSEVLLSQNK
ncbi:7-deoxyloganetin glucosyltransferase-like [Mercurialis annua]|uniref:7-deoxyloganetin glucosyltransferase-like n=1 Tax=Mercurialis annua TaxID=3986 RepID=UPI0021600165|nr:7-deoxyloganetin glucosyltransferase-like [Mercurialis annua]